jgi:deoxyribose-phosphate aldolase
MSPSELAEMIDHTLLSPGATTEDIEKLCREATKYCFASVCVNPARVELAASLLRAGSSRVRVCSVVGFPLGAGLDKAEEAGRVVRLGAEEIDMVISIGLLREGRPDDVLSEIEQVVRASSGLPVKVIMETCYLTDDQKLMVCDLAVEAGAAFVKTSTGFGSGGATEEDVRLLSGRAGGRIGVKASGGIGTLDAARRMIRAGATRLGCSRSVSIMLEAEAEHRGR